MDTQEDEDLYPPTYNAGRYEQAECVHHIHVQSIKQEPPPPPPFSITKTGAKKRRKLIHRRRKCGFFVLRKNF